MEDKREICKKLCELLKITRAGDGLVNIDYEKDGEEEYAKLYWQHDPGNRDGVIQKICITGDSGRALILDVMQRV